LKRHGHEVDLFCLTRMPGDVVNAEQLRPLLRSLHITRLSDGELLLNLVGGVFHEKSWNVSSYHSPSFLKALQDYAVSPDGQSVQAVLAHRLRMAPHADFFVKKRSVLQPSEAKIPWVLDLVDCLAGYTRQASERPGFPFTRRMASRWDTNLLSSEEPAWVARADASLVVAEPEREVLIRLGAPANRLCTIPNGIEKTPKTKSTRPEEYPQGSPVAALVGNLGYAPNEDGAMWFLDHVWPLVIQRVPNAVFSAVGGSPSRALLKRSNGRDIRIRGYVPDVAPYVAHASVTVAPLQVASGFQNKVALSLSMGIPVVATNHALKWIPQDLRQGISGWDTPEAFASALVERLLKSKAHQVQAKRMGAVLQKKFSWEASGNALNRLFQGLAGSSKRKN
jgi:glycosyltransferase involved in cell wall biosynthesis